MTMTVGGTEVAVILVEQASGFKVSFRSRCELDCSRVAERFGGGGHRCAAGAQLHEPLATGREKVLDAVRAAMREKKGFRDWGIRDSRAAATAACGFAPCGFAFRQDE